MTTNRIPRNEIRIPASFEVGIRLRRTLEAYEAHGGTINFANLRSLNYVIRRLNVRAIRAGATPTDLHYPAELRIAARR